MPPKLFRMRDCFWNFFLNTNIFSFLFRWSEYISYMMNSRFQVSILCANWMNFNFILQRIDKRRWLFGVFAHWLYSNYVFVHINATRRLRSTPLLYWQFQSCCPKSSTLNLIQFQAWLLAECLNQICQHFYFLLS